MLNTVKSDIEISIGLSYYEELIMYAYSYIGATKNYNV